MVEELPRRTDGRMAAGAGKPQSVCVPGYNWYAFKMKIKIIGRPC
jgi:hypothetical protein